jgi:hypothetical protein
MNQDPSLARSCRFARRRQRAAGRGRARRTREGFDRGDSRPLASSHPTATVSPTKVGEKALPQALPPVVIV